MDEFLSYFFDNKARYIKPDSPLYERLIAQDGATASIKAEKQ